MRLLNTRTLQFAEFFEADLPPYAILSHRWGKDEVSFRDFRKGLLKEGKGYEKIVKCCELAAAESLEWAWVDTCCIDKRSSAELSEAINSMFQWYAKAEVCFAFLADVHPATTSPTMMYEYAVAFGRFAFDELQFRDSSWFTRGWTLQELLAPSRLLFFNSAYQLIGEKTNVSTTEEGTFINGDEYCHTFNRLICDATGIPRRYVGCQTAEIHAASVGERMRWVNRRRTTRIEDMAYCLLGIFDVNMPLLYGEGKKAFTRLQVEINRRDADESLFAWTEPSLDGWNDLLAPMPHECRFLENTAPSMYYSEPLRQPLAVTSRGISLKTAFLVGVPILYVLDIFWNDPLFRFSPVAVLLDQRSGVWSKAEHRLFFGEHLMISHRMKKSDEQVACHLSGETDEPAIIDPQSLDMPGISHVLGGGNTTGQQIFEVFCINGYQPSSEWLAFNVLRKPDYLVDFPDYVFESIVGEQVVVCQPNDICTYIKRKSCQQWHPDATGRNINGRMMILERSLRKRIYIRQHQGW